MRQIPTTAITSPFFLPCAHSGPHLCPGGWPSVGGECSLVSQLEACHSAACTCHHAMILQHSYHAHHLAISCVLFRFAISPCFLFFNHQRKRFLQPNLWGTSSASTNCILVYSTPRNPPPHRGATIGAREEPHKRIAESGSSVTLPWCYYCCGISGTLATGGFGVFASVVVPASTCVLWDRYSSWLRLGPC